MLIVFKKTRQRKLRMRLVMQTGVTLDELPFAERYINGDDNALEELRALRVDKEKVRMYDLKVSLLEG